MAGQSDRGREGMGPHPEPLTVVLHPAVSGSRAKTDVSVRQPEARLAEAEDLAAAIGLRVVTSAVVPLHGVRPGTLFGPGKLDEMRALVAANGAELVIINGPLSPVQQRNLERALAVKVIDRTGLILEIFGARARTREGRLQVELAHLTYQRSRLVRSWTHLERQRGGFGFLGGPGETQIEADRRLISERITKIRRQLDHVRRTRELHRTSRRKLSHPVIALVGYTNAGKSTLFNRLTGARVTAADALFATLDPTMRGISLPSGRRVILSDTVGFVSDLPTHLVAAFRATLEEVVEADIILHVRDITHPESVAQRRDVLDVLAQLGIDERDPRPLIEGLNKIDLVDDEARRVLINRAARHDSEVPISARDGRGCADLLAEIDRHLARREDTHDFAIPQGNGALIAWLYRHGDVLSRRDRDGAAHLRVRLSTADLGRFCKKSTIADSSGLTVHPPLPI